MIKWAAAFFIVLVSGWIILRSNKQMNIAEAETDRVLFEVERGYSDRYGLCSNLAISFKMHANPPAGISGNLENARQACIVIPLRKAITSEKGTLVFVQYQVLLDSAIAIAADSVRSRTDLKSDMNINVLMNELRQNKSSITASVVMYNDGLEDYNAVLDKFPNSLFKGIFGYKKRYPIALPEDKESDQL